MRRVRYCVATSLDGYIAGPNGEADWILIDPQVDFDALWAEFDTLLMGRRTFATLGVKPGKSAAGSFPGKEIIVVSRTLNPHDYRGVTIVGENLKEFVTALKAQAGKDIWLWGGGDLFRSLLELDLVDSVEVTVMPVLLGQGIPLLPTFAGPVSLALASHRIYPKTGSVTLVYDVKSNLGGSGSDLSKSLL